MARQFGVRDILLLAAGIAAFFGGRLSGIEWYKADLERKRIEARAEFKRQYSKVSKESARTGKTWHEVESKMDL